MLNQFVELIPQLYGLKYVNYNAHSLLHLPNYVNLYGTLDSFSGYVYENYLQDIKETIKKTQNILKQQYNRTKERENLNAFILENNVEEYVDKFIDCNRYKCYKYEAFIFKNNFKDCNCSIKIARGEIPFLIEQIQFIDMNILFAAENI